ncbi:DUF6625 family protein [Desulfopila sp. IMCC35008]|uniref:DUF6625 family protein n=1 Tax=Desulfopila sp. IMCC35008 TaxID=2653858 RepID=UPI0013D1A4A5|nr:DUF6625 family protein [Desulfopila sp. IMCC35008]
MKTKSREDKSSIILMCAYMGPLPYWMPAFMASCRKNPDVNWLIVTNMDQSALPDGPSNVRFLNIDLKDFNDRVSSSLKIPVNVKPEYAYKINDFKVAYGKIFSKEFEGYDFWGYCDLDVVWGDIKKFITPEILLKYEMITSRIDRISGHFCLFKNENRFNEMYKDIPNVKTMMAAERNYAIDEEFITNYLYMVHKPNWVIRLKYFNKFGGFVKPNVYWNKVLTTSGAHQRALGDGTKRHFLWKNGQVFDADETELMYIHFHKMKKDMHTINFDYNDSVNEFIINREGLFLS